MRHADSRLPRTCLACAFLLILFAAVKGAATAPEARKPQPVAPSFQKASVGPVLLGKYDVPTSLAVSTTLKGKTNLAVSITKKTATSGTPLGLRGLITATGKLSKRDCTITSSVDDTGRIEAIMKDNSLVKGLSVQLTGHNFGKDLTDFAADIAADYTFSNPLGPAGFTGRVGMKDSHLSMSGVLGHGAALIGVFTEFDAEAGTLTEPALLATYTGSSYTVAAHGKAGGGNARVTFEQRITSSLSAAAELCCSGNAMLKGNAVTVALQNVFDGGHSLRCKLDSAAQTASLSAVVKNIVPHAVVSMSAKMDKGGSRSFGVSATFTPILPPFLASLSGSKGA